MVIELVIWPERCRCWFHDSLALFLGAIQGTGLMGRGWRTHSSTSLQLEENDPLFHVVNAQEFTWEAC